MSRIIYFGLFLGLFGSGLVAQGCAPRPPKNGARGTPPVLSEGEKAQVPDGATGFRARGMDWTLRQATPLEQEHFQSPFLLGDGISFEVLVSQDRAEITAPLKWPRSGSERLVFELKPVTERASAVLGQWSYRCHYADGSLAEDAQQQGRVEPLLWDREKGASLLLLEKVFGLRGERQDPSTLCHLEVRVEDEAPLLISLRVFGGFPTLEREEIRSISELGGVVEPGSVVRLERLRNPSLRRFVFTPSPKVTLESQQLIRMTRYLGREDSAPGPKQEQWLKASSRAYTLQWSVDGGAWRQLGSNLSWPPGVTHEIRYRVVSLPTSSGCKLRGSWERHYHWFEDRRGAPGEWDVYERRATRQESDQVIQSQISGSIVWANELREISEWGGIEVHEQGEDQFPAQSIGAQFESFDCQGWVS